MPNTKDKPSPNSKSKNALKTTLDSTSRHSIETSFAQLLIKEFFKKTKKCFNNIYYRLNEDENCFICDKPNNEYDYIDYKVDVQYYQLLKVSCANHKEKKDSYSDCKY